MHVTAIKECPTYCIFISNTWVLVHVSVIRLSLIYGKKNCQLKIYLIHKDNTVNLRTCIVFLIIQDIKNTSFSDNIGQLCQPLKFILQSFRFDHCKYSCKYTPLHSGNTMYALLPKSCSSLHFSASHVTTVFLHKIPFFFKNIL